MRKYFKLSLVTGVIDRVLSWRSKGISNKSIKQPATSDNSLIPSLDYYNTKIRVKFTRGYLKQPKISYTNGKVVNMYIAYELASSSSHSSGPTLKNVQLL